MSFKQSLSIVLAFEGGYINDPHDPGGETNFGISKKEYPTLNIKSLTKDKVADIYKRDYWDKCRCDRLHPGVALLVFDTAVNMGVHTAIIMLQQVSGANPDGIIGPRTIEAVRLTYPSKLIRDYATLRMLRYTSTKNWQRYRTGWTRRIFGIVTTSLTQFSARDDS